MDRSTAAPWVYSGDVNIEYGGIYVNLSDTKWGYAEVVEVTDLDSACGFTGAVMIEYGAANLPRTKREIRTALSYWGMGMLDLLEITDKAARRATLFHALWSYGHRDIENERTEVLQLEEDGPLEFDSWRAVEFVGDLRDYVESKL